jgi:hypothetical protein
MDDNPTGSILVNLVDGTRQPLADAVEWLATIHDGRSPSEWRLSRIDGKGPAELVKGLQYFDYFAPSRRRRTSSEHGQRELNWGRQHEVGSHAPHCRRPAVRCDDRH